MKANQDGSTRNILLTMLKTSDSLSVADMAKRLGITEMAIRRHMGTLERDGLVVTTLVRQAMGRPSHVYSLSKHAEFLFPKNYHGLTLDLLEEFVAEAEDQDEAVARLFDRRKNKLVRRYEERMRAEELRDKVEMLAHIQEENGYMATWSADEESGGYVIDEFNCPISHVANQYQHACQSELELFQELLGAEVERVECLAKDGKRCRYMIRRG